MHGLLLDLLQENRGSAKQSSQQGLLLGRSPFQRRANRARVVPQDVLRHSARPEHCQGGDDLVHQVVPRGIPTVARDCPASPPLWFAKLRQDTKIREQISRTTFEFLDPGALVHLGQELKKSSAR